MSQRIPMLHTHEVTHSTHAHSDSGVGAQVNAGAASSSGVIVFADSNGVGWGGNASTITASYSQSTHAHSEYVFSASNGVAFGTNGSTVTASYSQSTHSHAAGGGIAAGVNGAAATTAGTVVFSDGNNVSFGANASTITASASYSQSTHAHTDTGIGIAPGTDGATSVGVVTFSNANGLAFGSSAGSVVTGSYTQSTHPHTAFVLSASNDFVFGTNASTVTASFSQSTHAHSDTGVGVKVNGANATSTGVVDFVDSNGIGFGRAASQITASYSQSTHAHSAISGIAAEALTTYTSGTVVFSASTNLTISTNGQTILFSGPAAGGGGGLSYWQNASGGSASVNMNTVLLSASAGSLIVFPLCDDGGFPGDMTISTAMLNMTNSVSGVSSLSAFSSSWRLGLYTVSTAAGGGSTLALVNSVLTTAGSAASNLSLSTVLVGNRFLTIHSSAWSAQPVLSAGRDYYVGLVHNTAGTRAQTYGLYGQFLFSTQARSGSIGVSQPAAATWQGITPYAGVYSATTAALPASIHLTQVNKQVANAFFVPHMIFNNRVSSF